MLFDRPDTARREVRLADGAAHVPLVRGRAEPVVSQDPTLAPPQPRPGHGNDGLIHLKHRWTGVWCHPVVMSLRSLEVRSPVVTCFWCVCGVYRGAD